MPKAPDNISWSLFSSMSQVLLVRKVQISYFAISEQTAGIIRAKIYAVNCHELLCPINVSFNDYHEFSCLAWPCHSIGIRGMKMLDNRVVPWFPRDVGELDLVANKTLEAGVDIESDHPGFLDQGRKSITSPYLLTLHHITSHHFYTWTLKNLFMLTWQGHFTSWIESSGTVKIIVSAD